MAKTMVLRNYFVMAGLWSILMVTFCHSTFDDSMKDTALLTLTVATEETDGFQRFVRSARRYEHDLKVLGLGQTWTGGDVKNFPGGGQKVKLLKAALEEYKDRDDLIIMFVDSYDVILTSKPKDILERFGRFEPARVLFSAEGFCWPDKKLAVEYPVVKSGKRYLNSGGFMGYAKQIWEILNHKFDIKDNDDDQLFYTKAYLDPVLREKLGIKLDSTSRIFQNLNGATDDVELKINDENIPVLKNVAYSTLPCVIHGNGPSKIFLNHLGNYLGGYWNPETGCEASKEGRVDLSEVEPEVMPLVLIMVSFLRPVPFVQEFFENLAALDYPKNRIHVIVYNRETLHVKDVGAFVGKFADAYKTVEVVKPSDGVEEKAARNRAVKRAVDLKCDFLFAVDAEGHLTNHNVLKALISQNRGIVAPLLVRPEKVWSNFWGDLNEEGFYKRSDDYMAIIQNKRRSLWNVPFISTSYLVRADKLELCTRTGGPYTYAKNLDADMSFCQWARDEGHFLFISNLEDFGHLVNPDDFPSTNLHPELGLIFSNPLNWKLRYIHENYSKVLEPDFQIQQDERLTGGYENVPTRDIHMNQVGLEQAWLRFLEVYVKPVVEKVFTGYHNSPQAIMNFVVRYRPDEQPSLRPHHDASTYTIDVALNEPGKDYEGGGVRYPRYNCSVTDSRTGWTLLHPGRLTHLHEGLQTTKGTRYIMVSFVDP